MISSLSCEHKGALSGGSGGDSLRPYQIAVTAACRKWRRRRCVWVCTPSSQRVAHEQLIANGQKLYDLLWINVTPVDILDGQQTEI